MLDRAAAGQFGTGDESTVAAAAADGVKDLGLTLPEPPPNATPSQNAAWWATLSNAGREILIRDRPGTIGAMDGLPATDRHRANRVVLNRDYADLQHQRDDVHHRLDGMKRSDPQQHEEYEALETQLDMLNGKLSGMDQIKTRLDHPLPGQSPAFLLGINPLTPDRPSSPSAIPTLPSTSLRMFPAPPPDSTTAWLPISAGLSQDRCFRPDTPG
ncbi:hypothetical protein ACQPXB_08260 [Amycolatopsis sp. CA-161197]|uniref:hypothetical protein n=1 Tax=Amycolatopsis sp. CA-161197 TaxID=3239922 RepID=UPI003D8EA35A